MEDIPCWAECTLQGVSFWIGHRYQIYPHYPLPEGAIVGAACNLIVAHLKDRMKLRCEIQYSEIVNTGSSGLNRCRADLVVYDKEDNPLHVIEVKRAERQKARIDKDLQRLCKCKSAANKAQQRLRCFLLVASQRKRPGRFVSSKGTVANKSLNQVRGVNGYYRIRRACKGASSFEGQETAHYTVLVEAFAETK